MRNRREKGAREQENWGVVCIMRAKDNLFIGVNEGWW